MTDERGGPVDDSKRPTYPELDKMKAAREQSRTLTEFVDWLDEQGISLCVVGHRDYERIAETNERLFARFFDIDLDKVEREREQILAAQRRLIGEKP